MYLRFQKNNPAKNFIKSFAKLLILAQKKP